MVVERKVFCSDSAAWFRPFDDPADPPQGADRNAQGQPRDTSRNRQGEALGLRIYIEVAEHSPSGVGEEVAPGYLAARRCGTFYESPAI